MPITTLSAMLESSSDTPLRALWGMGPLELGIILVIVLLIFGAGKLPKIGKQLGDAMNSFKNAKAGIEDQREEVEVEAAPAKAAKAETEKREEVELG